MSKLRSMTGGRADWDRLEKGKNGRNLCRWCNLEIPERRLTFCSDWCVHEWRLRSDPGYLREQVFRRDRGVCALCQRDTILAFSELKRSRGTKRAQLLKSWGLSGIRRKSLWDADHIMPVAEGGGECDLNNLRTLCLICHRRETSALRVRLRRFQIS
jgi:5-methylcytosine-specific restriction protein A